ncbi:response regulator [Cohnella endophytica]|uniref:Response regulator n=1 Tax=Cohnella endophytica TaxID=2419778 RepID=A0A494XRT8_9BACL|nr:response regulator [Cohnella endophytica]RKP51566.1 response regulator [Cohnella endophytica]
MVKILIAEDEIRVREGLANFIHELGEPYRLVGTAANGEEALALMETEVPHILVTDIRMPRMDGLALLERVKRDYPSVVAVILSGYADFEYARQAIRFDVSDYLLKPLRKDKLEETLGRLAAESLQLPDAYRQMLHPQHKWDMPLMRLESKLLESLEIGDSLGLEQWGSRFLSEVRGRAGGSVVRVIPFLTDFAVSLRKRLSVIEGMEEQTEIFVNAIAEALQPEAELGQLEAGVMKALKDCSNTVSLVRRNLSPNILLQFRKILEENYRREITLQEIAQAIGVSQGHLSRMVSKELGNTFTDYLMALRMDKAGEILKMTELKVMDVAKRVGYDNPEYFTRLFKRHFGKTPLEYRSLPKGES